MAIRLLYQYGLISDLDLQFARLMTKLAGDRASPGLELASALVSAAATNAKQVCLDLARAADTPLDRLFPEIPVKGKTGLRGMRTPEIDPWVRCLKEAPVVGKPGEYKPLILDRMNRLYLYRYWHYERQIADSIHQRLAVSEPDLNLLKEGLQRYFGSAATPPDRQKVAAFAALTRRFCVISGGPGTGKTHTVAAIAALLLEQDPATEIRLSAPTGKAAARLREAVGKAATRLSPAFKERIQASTLHRLLGAGPRSPSFRRHRGNPLTADAVIVDEASMVPLALMAKLFQAVRPEARVILLGDKDQLASVEAGAVFGDICGASQIRAFSPEFRGQYREITGETLEREPREGHDPLTDCSVELERSYRFEATPVIGELSRAVNRGDARRALAMMRTDGEIFRAPLPERKDLPDRLRAVAVSAFKPLFARENAREALRDFEDFRVLCAGRKGPYGVEAVNTLVEEALAGERVIDPRKRFYRGRPVMITRNDYSLNLFNGDIGMIWEDKEDGLRAWFPDRDGALRSLSPARLPEHETAFAVTVHKSQGSEFERALLLLTDSPLLTRELLYTGISRAKRAIVLWADEEIFISAIGKRVERTSGLRDALRR